MNKNGIENLRGPRDNVACFTHV